MIPATVAADREHILRLLEIGRGYDFLSAAAPYLDAHLDDHYVRLMAVREYLKLGLVEPARELLTGQAFPVGLGTELAAVRRSLAGLKGARVPWPVHAERFDANLAALEARGHDAGSIRQAWAARSQCFELFNDKNGALQVRMRQTDGQWQWVPRLADHRAAEAARALPDGIGTNTPGPYLLEGLAHGWYFERIYKATRDTFLGYSCALFVAEPDAAWLAVVLHLHDWREILSDRRVFWFTGEGWAERLRRAWDDDLDLPFPSHALTSNAPGAAHVSHAVEVVQRSAELRERHILESFADLEKRYASRGAQYWARRFEEALSGRGAPLRILAAVSTHTTFLQHSMRDAKRAFESLGHKCVVLTEKTPYTVVGRLTYHIAIRELDPDLFFNIDHIRPEFGQIVPAHLPLLTWDQDQLPHVFIKANMQGIGKLDFVVGWSKVKCVEAGCNPKQFLYMHIPTSPEQFSGDLLTEEERERYECDVSYVSHASQTPREFHEQERAGYGNRGLQELLDRMFEITPDILAKYHVMGGGVAEMILGEACRRCGLQIKDDDLRGRLTGWYLWRLGDRIFRHEALEWVVQWARRNGRTFRIYGNGWDKHPTLAKFAAHPAAQGRELLCIYRASKINLQLMPAGFIHQRALDGLASGGFFLSRTTPSDVRGMTLRKLAARIHELGIDSNRDLIENPDPTLKALLQEHQGEWLRRVDPYKHDLLGKILLGAEVLQAEEAFPRFHDVLFDSAEEFARRAEHFLANEDERRSITAEMRQATIEHFSYRPTMDRFLRSMADYLRGACV
jgi:hypothetical protein